MGTGKHSKDSPVKGESKDRGNDDSRGAGSSARKTISHEAGNTPDGNYFTGAGNSFISTAGGIAHDLNTVITTIYGFSELALENTGDSPEATRNILGIISAADRAKMLTGQLLDLSRNASPEKIPVRVADALSDALSFIKSSVTGKIRIVTDITTPDARVMASPSQLFRIFMNLAMNAAEAMKEKGGRLTISTEKGSVTAEDEERTGTAPLIIRISDTGKGMDEPIAREIFKPFFTAGKENGTGLGLTVVADAVSDLGGTIEVATARGKGTTFTIIIPGAFFGLMPEKH